MRNMDWILIMRAVLDKQYFKKPIFNLDRFFNYILYISIHAIDNDNSLYHIQKVRNFHIIYF